MIEALGIEPSKPEETLSLGDPALLTLSVCQASARFGIAPPPNRRDRKSHAKKRKQEEIEAELEAMSMA